MRGEGDAADPSDQRRNAILLSVDMIPGPVVVLSKVLIGSSVVYTMGS